MELTKSFTLLMAAVLSFVSFCVGNDIMNFNFTATSLGMYRDNPLKVTLPFYGLIKCPGSQFTLRNIHDSQYNNCTAYNSGNIEIGHCGGGDIYLILHNTGVTGGVNYQIGNTYYYAIYGNANDGSYCNQGYKFQFKIVDPADLITSSSVIPDMTSSSDIFPSLSSTMIVSSSSSNPLNDLAPSSTTTQHSSSTTLSKRPVPTTTSSTKEVRPTDKPTTSTTKINLPIETDLPTRITVIGLTNGGPNLRVPSLYLTSIFILLATLLPLIRTLY